MMICKYGLIFLLCFFPACKEVNSTGSTNKKQVVETADSVIFVDSRGETVRIRKKPEKVICLYSSYLDMWFQAGGKVIGRLAGFHGQIPEHAMDAEVVGTVTVPNVEKIIKMEPDLVILSSNFQLQTNLFPIFKTNKIPFMALNYENFEEYLYSFEIMTALTGRKDLYETMGTGLKKEISGILKKVPREKKPKVLLLFASTRAVSARLSNTLAGKMLEDLGTVNIAEESGLKTQDTRVFSMEKVISEDPDFILVQTMGVVSKIKERLVKDIESNPAWKSLKAVRNKRYIYLPKDLFLYKPNGRYAEAYGELAKILYPDVFQ